jgi:hypothetical protein
MMVHQLPMSALHVGLTLPFDPACNLGDTFVLLPGHLAACRGDYRSCGLFHAAAAAAAAVHSPMFHS